MPDHRDMALSNSRNTSQVDMDKQQLIRTFTDTLDESTVLTTGTKEAQNTFDAKIEKRDRFRREQLVRGLGHASGRLQENEALMKALQKASEEFFRSAESKHEDSRYKGFWKKKQTVKSKVEQQLRQTSPQTLDEAKKFILDIVDERKAGHGKFYTAFHRICDSLNAHSDLFKIVPSQSLYTSVLSGSLSMIVQAAVYHTEIADNLATATANLCGRVAVCSKLVQVINTNAMHEELGEIYKQLFSFLLSAAKWFQKSEFSKLLGSFNKKIKEEHDQAVSFIKEYIDIITHRGYTGGLLIIQDVQQSQEIMEEKLDIIHEDLGQSITDLHSKVDDMRKEHRFHPDDIKAIGERVLQQLSTFIDASNWKQIVQDQWIVNNSILAINEFEDPGAVEGRDHSLPNLMMTRDEADIESRRLRPLIYGADGIDLAQNNRTRGVDAKIIPHLAGWIQGAATTSRQLWIDFPLELQEDTVARIAALNMIYIVAKADAPFLSYICRLPRQSELTDTQTPVGAGLLSVVHSLILQLLRFRPPEDSFCVDRGTFGTLSGDMGCWSSALGLLDSLLEHTPVVSYCIIHGLNELEMGEGTVRCRELLQVLLGHSSRPGILFSILFTSSGNCRALNNVIGQKDRASSFETTKGIEKRGLDPNYVKM